MIPKLSLEERALISNPSDVPLLEVVKDYDNHGKLCCFDVFTPMHLKHYNEKQVPWIERDRELLKARVDHEPTDNELMDDYCIDSHNAARFRAFYVLKYPEMVKRDYRRS